MTDTSYDIAYKWR